MDLLLGTTQASGEKVPLRRHPQVLGPSAGPTCEAEKPHAMPAAP